MGKKREPSIFVEVRGERLSLLEIAKKYGFTKPTIRDRYLRGLRGEDIIKPRQQGVRHD
jgi:hypothetical protein